ncbi:unnamed protein product, partial [Brenthis ino]
MQWPSYKNDAKLHILKREAILPTQNNPEEENKKLLVVNSESESKPPVGLSEGGGVNVNPPTNNSLSESPKSQEPTQLLKTSNVTDIKVQNGSVPLNSPKITDTKNITKAAINDTKSPQNITIAATNATTTDSDNLLQINSPGVVKRGLIVFGGFAILAAAYFIFYRKKNNKYDSNSTHNANDANQFRYGVLQSDDRRDNLELARIPLTMESDDDDEDEDLEIFDLEQKKKSLSYVNLQVNDEDIVLNGSKDESKNNLLLDIEDGPSDTLINWSSNGNKSIL